MDGTMIALEVGDPVENDSYEIKISKKPVAVSNFVLDAWFDPQASLTTQRDYMNVTSGPMQMSAGGYMVVLDYNTGKVTEVFGSKEAKDIHEAKKPAHPASRTARRMAKYSK